MLGILMEVDTMPIRFRPIVSRSLFLFFCLSTLSLWADVAGRVSGTIKDPSGAAVPHVDVKITNEDTGTKEATRTNDQGFYAFPSLPTGRWDLEVQHKGFKDYRQNGLVVDVNTALQVDVGLVLGNENQTIQVEASPVQVETTSTQMGEVINSAKMETVPLNGRSYTDLLALQPGVAPTSSGQYSAIKVSGNLNPGSLSVNGQREGSNGFMVNGGNVNEGAYMGTAIVPNLDSIAEFRILTNNSDAEYGNYSGGLINAITKSGTNQLHGSVFEFLRNTDLDARNFYSPTVGKFIQNQFGGTVGGPIVRDKLFIFGDYQGTRQIVGVSTGNIPVPSASDRAGNLSDIASQLTGTVQGPFWAQQLSNQLGYTVTQGEHYYTPGCNSSNCVFPNAQIPKSVITAPSQNLLKYIPLPNSGAYFSTAANNQSLRDDKGGIRVDYNSHFGMISGYYFADDYLLDNPYGGGSVGGFAAGTKARAQMVNIGDTKTFGANKVNEFRIHFMRFAYAGNTPEGGLGVTLSSLGFVTGANTSGIVVTAPAIEGVPPISFNSFSIGVPSGPSGQYDNTYQLSDSFSVVTGSHNIKFGGDIHYDQITHHGLGERNGTFSFSGSETGSDWADFLIGAPSGYTQGIQLPLHTRSKYFALFAQDSWRARSNLTLNYGLRWEASEPWYEAQGQLETIVPGQQSVVFPGSPVGWVFPGDPGVPKTIAPTRWNNFAPRLGLAYAPNADKGPLAWLLGGPGKTSIRGSFGIYYTAFENATGFNEEGDAPFGFFWASPTPPLFTTPFVDRSTGLNEGQRFPPQFPSPNASPKNPDNSIDWSQFLPIASSPGFWHKNKLPYAEQYSLSIQRQFKTNSVLTVAYVGTEGHSLLSNLEANPGNPALCLSVSQPSEVAPGSATCGPRGENGIYTRRDGSVINGTRSPLGPAFGSNGYYITIGNSNYNSLQTTFKHQTGPLEMLAGYTWSKAIDDSSGWSNQINPVNYKLSRGLSAFDVAHNFVASYHYTLPFAKLFGPGRLTNGWVITGITRFATGLPVTMTESDDNSLLGTFSPGAGPDVDRPNYTPGNLQFNDPRSGLPYLNKSLFSKEALGQLGTADVRFFHGPGINNWDMALIKDTNVTERIHSQFRFELFNTFNHAQFNSPSGNINSGSFGIVTSARDPRIAQAALKFLF